MLPSFNGIGPDKKIGCRNRDAIQFEICDNGFGMNDLDTRNIFKDPEFGYKTDIEQEVNTNYENLGIGMVIVKKMIKLIGATIELKQKGPKE
jgi:K+-sensing histidine kinase KdpD